MTEPERAVSEGPVSLQLNESLSKKVIKGGIWLFGLRLSNRGLGFIRTIILARLLDPKDFGLLGIALLVASTLDAFSQTGLQSALVYKKSDVESYLDVAWSSLAIRGMILFLLLVVTAPSVADFFNSDEAEWIIKVVAFNMLLTGFGNIGIVFFQKDLEFKKQFVYEFSATVVDLAVSISLAFILRNVWALVWGGMAKNFVRLILSYVLHPYRPKLRFGIQKFKELFSYGIWIFGSTVLVFLITQGDDIFVGKFLGVTALGFYQMAFLISNLPATEIADVISRVTFPAYSKLQNDRVKLGSAFLKVVHLTAYVSIPLAGGIFILSHEFVEIFLGAKWLPMVPAVRILALSGLIGSISATTRPVFQGTGNPRIDTKWQIFRLIALIAVIYPFSRRWGISGVSLAVLISTLTGAVGFNVMAIRITGCSALNWLKMVALPVFNTLGMFVLIMLIKKLIGRMDLSYFILLSAAGIIGYFAFTCLLDRFFNYGVKDMTQAIWASLNS